MRPMLQDQDRDQDLKCQDQDCRISVSSCLKTNTAVSRTIRLTVTKLTERNSNLAKTSNVLYHCRTWSWTEPKTTRTLDPHFSTVVLAVDTACLTPSSTFGRSKSRNIPSILHIVFSTSFWQVSDDRSLTCLSNSSRAFVPTSASFSQIHQSFEWPFSGKHVSPSALWHCWLGARKDIQHVKFEWWCWCGYVPDARCRLFANGLVDVTARYRDIHFSLTGLSYWRPGKGPPKRTLGITEASFMKPHVL